MNQRASEARRRAGARAARLPTEESPSHQFFMRGHVGARDAPPPSANPPPRALPARGPGPIPVKDSHGRKLPTNFAVAAKWNKPLPPAEPLPPHMELNWSRTGPVQGSSGTISAAPPPAISLEEALTPDVVAWLEEHGVQAALERAVRAITSTSPRPADPIAALGLFISREAELSSADAEAAPADVSDAAAPIGDEAAVDAATDAAGVAATLDETVAAAVDASAAAPVPAPPAPIG